MRPRTTRWAAKSPSRPRCVSALENQLLQEADPQNMVYQSLRASFESQAIAECELAGVDIWGASFASTDCASGMEPVTFNLVWEHTCYVNNPIWHHEMCYPLFCYAGETGTPCYVDTGESESESESGDETGSTDTRP